MRVAARKAQGSGPRDAHRAVKAAGAHPEAGRGAGWEGRARTACSEVLDDVIELLLELGALLDGEAHLLERLL